MSFSFDWILKARSGFCFRKERQAQISLSLFVSAFLPSISFAETSASNSDVGVYNTTFLHGAGSEEPAELTAVLSSGNDILPGIYRVDIRVNGGLKARRDVVFNFSEESKKVTPCVNVEMLKSFGVDLDKLAASTSLDRSDLEKCYIIPDLIEHATVMYDPSQLRLDLSFPQAFMQQGARGYVAPELWDDGITVGYSNYQLNTRRARGNDTNTSSTFLGLQNGINLGSWHLRNESSLSVDSNLPSTFTSNRSFIQRDITALKSQFILGEVFTDSTLFDSARIRGVKLESDDSMLADSERGYAPVIRGVAETNATVEVRQSGFMLYSTNVTPGPFVLSNIFPSGSNGDLEITIVEADGRRRTIIQAYSSLPLMIRKGRMRYSLAAGRFDGGIDELASPKLFTGNLTYGVTDDLTAATGAQISDGFQAANIGVGTNTPIGAVSLDVTQSSSDAAGGKNVGQSVRLLYAKTFASTYTNFTLAAYRYSTEGYRTLSDHVQDMKWGAPSESTGRSRARLDVTINQDLGGPNRLYGSLYISASDQSYWGSQGRSRSISAGYGNSWKQLNYDFSLTSVKNITSKQDRSGIAEQDTQLTLSLSLPLGSGALSPRASMVTRRDNEGGLSHQVGVSGYLPSSDRNFYAVQAGRDAVGRNSGSASLGTTTSFGRLDVGVSHTTDYDSLNVGANGSVVAHAGGINLGQRVGETFALAQVKGAQGVGISSSAGSETGYNGYAIVPYAQPYRTNWISLDTSTMNSGTDVEDAMQQVIPRRGAVVKATFQGRTGRRVQFQLHKADGSKIPFGASVSGVDGKLLAITDPTGKALVLVEENEGQLNLKWGTSECTASYKLPDRNDVVHYDRVELLCR